MTEETLEQVAEKYASDKLKRSIHVYQHLEANVAEYVGFIAGAKWQAERMYSEQDLKEAFKVNYTPFLATNIGDFNKDWNKWFEQFKKK